MIVVLKKGIVDGEREGILRHLKERGFTTREIVGEEESIIGAVGANRIDPREIELLSGVARVVPISKAYKLASRELKSSDTVVKVGGVRIGGSRITVISGPCAVESREQIMESARIVKEAGGVILRGGAYKPRTSPYSFQGLAEKGLEYLKEAGERHGLPVATEIVSTDSADMMVNYVDLFQIGARNMQNFELLKKVGALGRPVLLKRGLAATIEEWLMAAEYLMAHGSEEVILCERGIRTFEPYTRNTLDLSAIPVVKTLSHLPVVVDPSHATGSREKVPPMALASVMAGADGVMVEVHPTPDRALSDGPQSLYPEELEKLIKDISALSPVVNKELERSPGERKHCHRTPNEPDSQSGDGELTVAFQGARGAYSEQAIRRYFQDHPTRVEGCVRFEEIFGKVQEPDGVDFGVIPIENSLTGSIHENYDLLINNPGVEIVGEVVHRIQHSLIGYSGRRPEELEKIFSHPQALTQCATFLKGIPDVEKVPFYDTAGSVAHVAESKNPLWGAIANAAAATYYGLTILKEGIESNPSNYTRFFILAKRGAHPNPNPQKASCIFTLPDKAGALYNCIQIFAEEGLNMTKLESRPQIGQPWQYMFYVDVEVERGQGDRVISGLERLQKETENFRNLGMYSRG